MKIEITDYPNSYLKVNMEEGDSITTEKSSFILSSGQFTAKNILEIGSYKNLIAKIAGKSLSYVEYMANKRLRSIGLKAVYDQPVTNNPLPWTRHWLNSRGLQNAPQETEIESYIVGGIKQDVEKDSFKGFKL